VLVHKYVTILVHVSNCFSLQGQLVCCYRMGFLLASISSSSIRIAYLSNARLLLRSVQLEDEKGAVVAEVVELKQR